VTICRFCSAPLSEIVADLGVLPLSNAYVHPDRLLEPELFYPCVAYVCERCFLVQVAAVELLVPEGFAQGFQTLEDATEVNYHVSREYHPEVGEGFRWNDPAFAIQWPLDVTVISERDRSWPDFSR
jgi:hypothetical protein